MIQYKVQGNNGQVVSNHDAANQLSLFKGFKPNTNHEATIYHNVFSCKLKWLPETHRVVWPKQKPQLSAYHYMVHSISDSYFC